jgi:hypothetical protein
LDESTGVLLFVPRNAGPDDFAELVGYRAGRYKLAAIDGNYQFLRHVPIVSFTITSTMAASHAAQAAQNPGAAPAGATVAPAPPLVQGEGIAMELVQLLRSALTETRSDPLVGELLAVLRSSLAESRTALTESLGVVKAQAAEGARNVSELVRASATVVTAADGAGISRRDPLPVVVPPVTVEAATQPATDDGATAPQNLGEVVSGALSNFAPMLQHFMNTKVFRMSEETSLAMLRAMSGAGGPANAGSAAPAPAPAPAPAASAAAGPPPSAAPTAINPAALWPHLAAVEQLLNPGEAAVVRRYLSAAAGDQVEQLAREVMARSAPDAAAWIRAVLADVEGMPQPDVARVQVVAES